MRVAVLSDTEKAAAWPDIKRAIPQIVVYQQRTKQNIRVFRARSGIPRMSGTRRPCGATLRG
jgi:hypothetical protein